jgi:hypothetical protein
MIQKKNPITSITAVLLPFVTYLLTLHRTNNATVISVIETESDSVEKYQEMCNIKLLFRVYSSGLRHRVVL